MNLFVVLIACLTFVRFASAQESPLSGVNIGASYALKNAADGTTSSTSAVSSENLLKLAQANPCFHSILLSVSNATGEFKNNPELKKLTDTFGPARLNFKYANQAQLTKKTTSTYTYTSDADLIAFLEFPKLDLYNQSNDLAGPVFLSESIPLKGNPHLLHALPDAKSGKTTEVYSTDDKAKCEAAAKQAFTAVIEKAKASKADPASTLSLLAGRMKAAQKGDAEVLPIREALKKISSTGQVRK